MTTRHPGFTLTEISIVATIVAILGVAILIGINPLAQIFKGYDSRRKADLSEIRIALENYYADHDCYPNFPKTGEGLPTYECGSDILSPYLKSMPCDPNTNEPYQLYLKPIDSICPQNFAIYAKTSALFDRDANDIYNCPNTIDIHSEGMTELDLVYGCSNEQLCEVHYGCVNGACVVIADEKVPTCAPSFCDSECSPIKKDDGTFLNCSTINPDTGAFTRECLPI